MLKCSVAFFFLFFLGGANVRLLGLGLGALAANRGFRAWAERFLNGLASGEASLTLFLM